MRFWATRILLCGLTMAGCGSNSVVGSYRIEQLGDGFGPQMDKIELNIKEDKTYEIVAGNAKWFVGTWTLKDNMLEISSSNAHIGTTFQFWKGGLYPFANGQEIKGWHWTR